MEIISLAILLILPGIYLIYKSLRKSRSESSGKLNIDDFQEQIEQALSLPQASGEAWQNEAATELMMQDVISGRIIS